MDKKYKLVIPDMVDKKHATLVTLILAYDRCILNSDCFSWNVGSLYYDGCKYPIPKEWLQEVKEPMTFDEYINLTLKQNQEHIRATPSDKTFNGFDMDKCWNAAIKSYKLELKYKIQKIYEPRIEYHDGLRFVLDTLEED